MNIDDRMSILIFIEVKTQRVLSKASSCANTEYASSPIPLHHFQRSVGDGRMFGHQVEHADHGLAIELHTGRHAIYPVWPHQRLSIFTAANHEAFVSSHPHPAIALLRTRSGQRDLALRFASIGLGA